MNPSVQLKRPVRCDTASHPGWICDSLSECRRTRSCWGGRRPTERDVSAWTDKHMIVHRNETGVSLFKRVRSYLLDGFRNKKLSWQQSKRWISALPFFLSYPRRCSSAALKSTAVTLEGPRSSSPAGNQPSFFHEAVSVQERLWISPAAPASNTSCYTLGNMTTALPPSSLHLNTLLYLMTW